MLGIRSRFCARVSLISIKIATHCMDGKVLFEKSSPLRSLRHAFQASVVHLLHTRT